MLPCILGTATIPHTTSAQTTPEDLPPAITGFLEVSRTRTILNGLKFPVVELVILKHLFLGEMLTGLASALLI
jgi:hypothetical protein